MIRVGGRTRGGFCRLFAYVVAAQLLLCVGTGLVSIVLAEDPNPSPGCYDGDGDDAATTSEGFVNTIDLGFCERWTSPPILTVTLFGRFVAPVSPPNPGRSQPPLLRSPPA
jgi:hypothetical protein